MTALVISVGGVRLAREHRIERIARDREQLNAFASALQEELRRLEDVYIDRLKGLASEDLLKSSIALKEEAENIWGIRQVSLLRKAGRSEFSLAIDDGAALLPVPMFDEGLPPSRREVRWLDPEVVGVGNLGSSGWLVPTESDGEAKVIEGDELLFWQIPPESSRQVLVLAIDGRTVTKRIDDWLQQWLADTYPAIWRNSGPDILTGPFGELASVGEIPDFTADYVQLMSSRFGNWQLQSWDVREAVLSYNSTVIKTALSLALAVVIAGAFVYAKLRQALHLAAKRVSFVNHVSHELRTPLTNILLNVDLASEGVMPAAAKRLQTVRDEAGRLRRLIDNVLTFSMLRQDENAVESSASCKVAEVIDEVLEQYAGILTRRNFEVDWSGADRSLSASVESDSLAQIVGNLISNSEKYAADGRYLKVELHADGADVVVRVSDRGPGIPQSRSERVFDAFYRVDDRIDEGSSGTGLGLNIARCLAERHGGSLQLVDAAEPGGAVLELRLPRIEPTSVPEVIPFPESQAS